MMGNARKKLELRVEKLETDSISYTAFSSRIEALQKAIASVDQRASKNFKYALNKFTEAVPKQVQLDNDTLSHLAAMISKLESRLARLTESTEARLNALNDRITYYQHKVETDPPVDLEHLLSTIEWRAYVTSPLRKEELNGDETRTQPECDDDEFDA